MEPPSQAIYEFGPFRLDPAQHVFLQDGRAVPLPPKAFEILALLVERRGVLVSKQELQERVWSDTFVDENNLAQHISLLRKLLGETHENPRYIETVPRVGYRFIASVEVFSLEPLQSGARPVAAAVPATSRPRSWAILVLSAALAAILLLLAGVYFQSRRKATANAANPQRIRSLVVLPLANLTGDPNQDYFVDAMTDSLITDLAQIHDLRVISATSATHYRGTHKTLPEIARELNVDGVVEGTVFRSGEKVRITAQLVDAPTDRHLWAHSYERDLQDIIRMQDEVARDIASQIKIRLTPREQLHLSAIPAVNPEAYQLYLQGRYFWERATEENLRKSVDYFLAAIAKDPSFAPAHAGLAYTYVTLVANGYDPPMVNLVKARAEATRALELDDTLAEAHLSLGDIELALDRDWFSEERELNRALELNPNSVEVHLDRGSYFLSLNHFDEAINEMQRAHELDPVGMLSAVQLGQAYFLAARYDESILQLKKTLELDPNFLPAHANLALVYTRKGMRTDAAAAYEKTRSLMAPRQALILDQWMAPVEILLGKRALAVKTADWWARESTRRYTDAYYLGLFYAELGDKQQAFKWLDIAFDEHSPGIMFIKLATGFSENIRSDSRFEQLLRRMSIPGESPKI